MEIKKDHNVYARNSIIDTKTADSPSVMRFDTAIIKIYIQYHCHGRWHLLKIHLNQLGHPKKRLTQGRWLLLLQIDTCQAANSILTIKIKFKWNLIISGLPVTTGCGVFILIIILSIAISVSTETEKTFLYQVTGMLLKKENAVNTFYFIRMLAYFFVTLLSLQL